MLRAVVSVHRPVVKGNNSAIVLLYNLTDIIRMSLGPKKL